MTAWYICAIILPAGWRKILDIEIITFNGHSKDFALAMEVRQKVFVLEQNVPVELEHDEFDEQATHVLLLADAQPVGTGRFFADLQQANTARLGRVAVLREYRELGFGQALLARLLAEIKNSRKFNRVLIHAQIAVVDLYARFGFEKRGKDFMEAGIAHCEMIYTVS